MAHHKRKTCLYCYTPLIGRRDAKTCSPRCRKRLQRARLLLEENIGNAIEPGFSSEIPGRVVPSSGGFVLAKASASRRQR